MDAIEDPHVSPDLARAAACCEAGALDEAADLLDRVLHADPDEPTALRYRGVVAFRAGDAAQALCRLRQAVAADPRDAEAQFTLGNLLRWRLEPGAIAAYRACLALGPHDGASAALVVVLADAGRLTEAEAAYAAWDGPQAAYEAPLRALAHACRQAGRLDDALARTRQLTALYPRAHAGYVLLSEILAEAGRAEDAVRAAEQALALAPDHPAPWTARGRALALLGRGADAAHALDRADALVPAHLRAAFRQQSLVTAAAAVQERIVLALMTDGAGNTPLDFIVPRSRNTVVKWFVEHDAPGHMPALPRCDVVLNAIGDPDSAAAALPALDAAASRVGTRILNAPSMVLRTHRDGLPALLGNLADVQVPAAARVTAADMQRFGPHRAVLRARIDFPLIVRDAGSHGGQTMRLITCESALRRQKLSTDRDIYVTRFYRYVSPDGYWRKYRVIFVDGVPYPYHEAISSHWVVHHITADMLGDPARRAEEQRFLEDPRLALGLRAWTAIAAIGARAGLEFCGLDCALLPDGRVLVFEMNAAMLVHPETAAEFAFKNPPVQRILDAVEAMLARETRVNRAAMGATNN